MQEDSFMHDSSVGQWINSPVEMLESMFVCPVPGPKDQSLETRISHELTENVQALVKSPSDAMTDMEPLPMGSYPGIIDQSNQMGNGYSHCVHPSKANTSRVEHLQTKHTVFFSEHNKHASSGAAVCHEDGEVSVLRRRQPCRGLNEVSKCARVTSPEFPPRLWEAVWRPSLRTEASTKIVERRKTLSPLQT